MYRKENKKNPYFRVMIPNSKFNEIFNKLYENVTEEHCGIEKTLMRISQLY